MSREPASEASAPSVGRRRVWIVAAAVVAVLLGIAVIVLAQVGRSAPTADGGATTSSSASTSASATPTAAPAPAPTATVEGSEEFPPALPAVALDGTAEAGNGISASLSRIEAIQGSGIGPGNVAGPALRVTVRIHNETADPLPVDGVAVNMSYGIELTPASPLDDPSQAPFRGVVAPGDTSEAVYVFSIPSDARDSVTVEVGYQAGGPRLLFAGPVD